MRGPKDPLLTNGSGSVKSGPLFLKGFIIEGGDDGGGAPVCMRNKCGDTGEVHCARELIRSRGSLAMHPPT